MKNAAKFREKYRSKYGRDPSEEELAAYTQTLKEKKARKKAEETAAVAAAAASESNGASPPSDAAQSAAAPLGVRAHAGGKRRRADKSAADETALESASDEQKEEEQEGRRSRGAAVIARNAAQACITVLNKSERQDETAASFIYGPAKKQSYFVKGMTSMCNAVRRAPETQAVSEQAFAAMWAEVNTRAVQLLKEFDEGLQTRAPHLSEEQREAFVAPYRERLALSLTPADDVIERCRSKQAAKDAARRAKAARRTPRTPKEHAVEPAIRDAGLAVLREHRCVVLRLF